MMKTPAAVTQDIARRLSNRWHLDVTGSEATFPHVFPLGQPSAADLRADYAAVHSLTVQWQEWAKEHSIALVYRTRVATGGTRQTVPTHAQVQSIDHAAAIVGGPWPERLKRSRRRLAILREHYPLVAEPAKAIRLLDPYSVVDFELLLTVADWYLAEPTRAHGITPRQVPIPGVHGKWLESHRAGVLALTGLDELGLLPAHPQRIHFTYLDPAHRAAGSRVHDSATVGDSFEPAYVPDVVVISENKDTAIHFPELTGGISVEGVGRGGRTVASFPWIREAPVVVYWGDMDRDGYEILNGYRIDFDRDIDSILMDSATYEEFEPFGTSHDQNGRELPPGNPRPVPRLRPDELAVYERLIDAQHQAHRRVEQERIPLARALHDVRRLMDEGVSRTSQGQQG